MKITTKAQFITSSWSDCWYWVTADFSFVSMPIEYDVSGSCYSVH